MFHFRDLPNSLAPSPHEQESDIINFNHEATVGRKGERQGLVEAGMPVQVSYSTAQARWAGTGRGQRTISLARIRVAWTRTLLEKIAEFYKFGIYFHHRCDMTC